jgi:hypothetical protein
MWVYVGDDDRPYNVFDFTLNRGRDGPKYSLKDYNQVLLADAYGGYNGVVVGNQITRAGCWAHWHRKVIEAENAAPEIARQVIEMVRALYVIEKQATDLRSADRLEVRQRQSEPLLAEIREKMLVWKEQLLPKHPMAETINYVCLAKVHHPPGANPGRLPLAPAGNT